MTQPPVDSTPILIIAWAALMFVVVILIITSVLNAGDKTEEFEPYDEGCVNDGEKENYTFPVPDEKMEGFIKDRLSLAESDKIQTKEDLEYFDIHTLEWMMKTKTPSYSDHEHWKRAFRLYNRHHATVSMFCRPHYINVLKYIIQLKNEKLNN